MSFITIQICFINLSVYVFMRKSTYKIKNFNTCYIVRHDEPYKVTARDEYVVNYEFVNTIKVCIHLTEYCLTQKTLRKSH